MPIVPYNKFRIELNFFTDFFPNGKSFIDFLNNNVLDIDSDFQDDFILSFYKAFAREYRNLIIQEQEFFIDDFTNVFTDNKRKFEILYSLWKQANDEDPYQMIRDGKYEYRTHHRDASSEDIDKATASANEDRTDSITQNDSATIDSNNSVKTTDNTEDTSDNTSLSKSNDGKIQNKLALSEMDVTNNVSGDVSNYATSASVDKNKRTDTTDRTTNTDGNEITKNDATSNTDGNYQTKNQSESERTSKSQQQVNSQDEAKWFDQNKVDLIEKFIRKELKEGFQAFVKQKDFASLFGHMNAGEYSWWGYVETNWEDIPEIEVPTNDTPLSTLIKNTNIGFIPKINSENITQQVIYVNEGATINDFFVSNIFADKKQAYLVGKGKYEGYLMVTFITK